MGRYGRYLKATAEVCLKGKTLAQAEAFEGAQFMARECDDLAERLEREARYLSRKFLSYADDVAKGMSGSDPTTISSLRDITVGHELLRSKAQDLVAMIRALLGTSAVETFRALLQTSYEDKAGVRCKKCNHDVYEGSPVVGYRCAKCGTNPNQKEQA